MAGERILPGLGLRAYWTPGSDGYNSTLDPDLRKLSALVHGAVISRTTEVPVSLPDGAIYIVPSTATGDPNKIVLREAGETITYNPLRGMRLFVTDEGAFAYYNGSSWVPEAEAAGGIADAPEDGETYGRKDGAWVAVEAGSGGGGIEEAPLDGTPYVRQDGGWVSAPEGGGGGDGLTYYPVYGSAPGLRVIEFESSTIPADWTLVTEAGYAAPVGYVIDAADPPRTKAFRFGDIAGSQKTAYRFPINAPASNASIKIRMKQQAEPSFDTLRVYSGSTLLGTSASAGHQAFADLNFPLSPGAQTIELRFEKDGGSDYYDDTIFIFRVEVTTDVPAAYERGAYVQHSTGLYRALVDNPGAAPTGVTNGDWLLIEGVGGDEGNGGDGGTSGPGIGDNTLAGAHRHWRFVALNSLQGSYFALSEFEAYELGDTSLATNLCTGATFFAGGQYNSQAPALANDGNAATYYESQQVSPTLGTGQGWIGFTLPVAKEIKTFVLKSASAENDEAPRAGRIEWADSATGPWVHAKTFFTIAFTGGGTAQERVELPMDMEQKFVVGEDVDRMVLLSQAAYDALATKNSRTLYLIPVA